MQNFNLSTKIYDRVLLLFYEFFIRSYLIYKGEKFDINQSFYALLQKQEYLQPTKRH